MYLHWTILEYEIYMHSGQQFISDEKSVKVNVVEPTGNRKFK